jgi:outer membrane protein
MTRILVVLTLLFGFGYANPGVAGEPLHIAFVNIPQILEQAPQADAVRETLNQEFSARDIDLASGDKKLDLLKLRLEREGAGIAEEERRKLERELLTQDREMKRSHEEYNEDRNIRKNEELAKMQREIRLSIVTLAKSLGYDMVLESGVMYASDRVDITGLVITRLKQNFGNKNSQAKP